MGFLIAAGTAAVVWIAARDVLAGRLEPGDVVLLVAYAVMLFKPLETLAYTAASAQSATAGARRILAVLESEPVVRDLPQARTRNPHAPASIRFDQVSFAFGAGVPVLQGISLEITAGQSLALVLCRPPP